ncbi:MAG: 3'-5' exonuclease [Gallionella sp.]|nr:3'-5' exonuclease [Gallionella sp.]MDD4958862.1 3'-5' exonuclease [Gallionella sp.]
MYKVIQTKVLNDCFRKLQKSGKKGKDSITKVRAALSEAGTEGEIKSLQRTKNGESRLDNVEKYDLGDGHRLVVQLVDAGNNARAFLFAGDHEDCEQWLDTHKDYRWVKSDKDHTLDFVQVSEKEPLRNRIVSPDIESPEALRGLPLLRHLKPEDWQSLAVNETLKEYVLGITPEKWECDPTGILDYIEKEDCVERAILFDDLFSHAHKGELNELTKRVFLEIGKASVSSGYDLLQAIYEPQNSEIFVTWEEVHKLPEDSSWADWLLFLHPEQKVLSTKEFRGAVRLRGVSGSGKTCVMLHRARFLAKKYKEPVLLVTLTESMRKLLDSLIKELCGVESSFIQTLTVSSLAQQIVKTLHQKGEAAYMMLSEENAKAIKVDTVNFVKNHKAFLHTKLGGMDSGELTRFIEEEIFYIRSRLKHSEFDDYLDSQTFKRHGRVIGLSGEARRVFLDAAHHKTASLKKLFKLDHEGVVSAAVSLLTKDIQSLDSFGWSEIDESALTRSLAQYEPYRCVLVDEVQDLSQLELAMIAGLPKNKLDISKIENGLFLVGDGAQTIYNKGFVLKNCGINVSNRSYVLKKNYRNSKEIMLAAYALIEKHKFADVDEDNIDTPTRPDLATKTGEKPYLVKCKDEIEEVQYICNIIKDVVKEYQQIEDTEDYPEICVIGLNQIIRKKITTQLTASAIRCSELKHSSGAEGCRNSVVVSTIESAKGHEFRLVFIAGVIEGVIPNKHTTNEDISREASRLYVAMTRARDKLFVSYYTNKQNQPSRFLMDIQSHCDEYEWSEGRLKMID